MHRVILLLLLLFSTQGYGFIGSLPGLAETAKQGVLLKRILESLNYMKVVNRDQGSDIKRIYGHFADLQNGEDFISVARQELPRQQRQDINEAESVYDEYSEWEDDYEFVFGVEEEEEEAVVSTNIGTFSKSDIARNSKSARERIAKIQKSKESLGSDNQNSAIKKGVEYSSISAQEQVSQTDLQRQELALLKSMIRKEKEEEKKLSKAFSFFRKKEDSDKNYKKFYKRIANGN